MPRKPDPTRRRIKLELDEDLVDAIQESVGAQVAKAQRVAVKAALELDREDRDDKRTGALAIARALAQAGRLAEFSEVLLAAWVTAGGKAPAPVVAKLVADAEATVTAPASTPTRAQVLAGLQEELDKINGADPDDDELGDALTGLTAEPPPAGPPTLEQVAAETAAALASGGAEDKHVGDADLNQALAAIQNP